MDDSSAANNNSNLSSSSSSSSRISSSRDLLTREAVRVETFRDHAKALRKLRGSDITYAESPAREGKGGGDSSAEVALVKLILAREAAVDEIHERVNRALSNARLQQQQQQQQQQDRGGRMNDDSDDDDDDPHHHGGSPGPPRNENIVLLISDVMGLARGVRSLTLQVCEATSAWRAELDAVAAAEAAKKKARRRAMLRRRRRRDGLGEEDLDDTDDEEGEDEKEEGIAGERAKDREEGGTGGTGGTGGYDRTGAEDRAAQVGPPPRQFLWNDLNYLLTATTDLDFLEQ
eukprot:g2585.t1